MHGVDVETRPVIELALGALEENDWERCATILEEDIKRRDENPVIDFLLKSVIFWQAKIGNAKRGDDPVERARYLLMGWEKYRGLFREDEERVPDFDRYSFVFRKAVAKIVLLFLTTALHNPLADERRAHLYMGRAHKSAGNYEEAIAHYRRVIANADQCAEAYAELGDCYLLIGNEHIGRLFLREAFYIRPEVVEFEFLESELLQNVMNKLRASEDMSEVQYRRWLPTYAVLWDVFTIKRDLKTAEYGVLRQRIYALEREYSESQDSALEPRLLYAYFYLLDYYYKVKDDIRLSIEETLMKIKRINPKIYDMYIEGKK